MIRFLISLFFFLGLAFAQTGEAVQTGHANSRLIAEKTAAVPGETLWVALAQELDEHWHVYWKNPGDSGLPLSLGWTLPAGWQAGEIGYPLPHRLPLGPLVNYGHEGSPLFLVPMTIPTDAPLGETVTLSVFAEWLICYDVCIPESADLSLTIPVAASASDVPGQADAIRAALSAQPRDLGLAAQWSEDGENLTLRIEGAPAGEAYFYAATGGLVEPAGLQPNLRQDGALWIQLNQGLDYSFVNPEELSGIIVLDVDGQEVGVQITAPKSATSVATSSQRAALARGGAGSTSGPSANLFLVLLFALIGGLILNLMPCVFPIVFLKASSVASLAGAEAKTVRQDAYAYTAGVLVTFAAMAGLLLILRAGGASLGWGFHLQSPIVVGLCALVVFLIGLNLTGLFEVGTSVQGAGSELTQKKGPAGSFFTGLLAVVVAAPCIGPFLGLPIGYALSASPIAAIIVFLALGLGLALPYLALAAAPGLAKALPKPGPWMIRLKQLFAFAMFGTTVWLTSVVAVQAGPTAVTILGITFVAAGFAGWLFGLNQQGGAGWLRIASAAALLLAIVPLFSLKTQAATGSYAAVNKEAYDETRLAALMEEGTPVFIDFTAAWCVTCQYNKRVVLDTAEMQQLFAETGTVFMVADLTNPDPVISAAIERQGRSGVPLYLYYRGEGAPEILPQILTAARMRETLERS